MAATNLGTVPLGSLPTVTLSFADSSGNPVDPTQIRVQLTSGTTQTLSSFAYPADIIRQSQGVYTFQPSCTEPGLWQGVGYCPTGLTGQTAQDFYFSVDDSPFPISGR